MDSVQTPVDSIVEEKQDVHATEAQGDTSSELTRAGGEKKDRRGGKRETHEWFETGTRGSTKFLPQLSRNRGNGRPKKRPVTITENVVFRLAECMCKPEDLALKLGCSVEHLQQSYGGIISKAHASTRMKLLEVLRNQALVAKNERILVWLSKCWLGMSEPVAAEPSTVINVVVADVPSQAAMEPRTVASGPRSDEEVVKVRKVKGKKRKRSASLQRVYEAERAAKALEKAERENKVKNRGGMCPVGEEEVC